MPQLSPHKLLGICFTLYLTMTVIILLTKPSNQKIAARITYTNKPKKHMLKQTFLYHYL